MPRVSIIIPVYNVEPYIEECLLSVYEQTTDTEIECLIVDDKGKDNSIHIAETFVATHNDKAKTKFKIIYRDTNGGLSAARNTGVKAAKGDYLYFLDSDDTIVPQCIDTLIHLADKYGGVDLLPALYLRENNEMSQFGRESFPEFSDDRSLIKRSLLDYDKIPVTAANRLIKRELITNNGLYFKEGIVHEDNYWTFFLAKHVRRMAFCAEKLYYYRETPGSITKKPNIEKETHAFSIIIKDFCNNIDNFEEGAQKRLTLLTLLNAKNKHYLPKKELNQLIYLFRKHNNILEKIMLDLILYLSPQQWLYKKSLNIIQRLYSMS